jgi:hypothetical protein
MVVLVKYLGYTLILLITVAFVVVALSNSRFDSTVSSDVVMASFADSRNTIFGYENRTNPFRTDLSLNASSCTRCDFFSNFSMLHFQVSMTAPRNETIPNPIVEVFIEDQSGYVVGYGSTLSDSSPFWKPTPGGNKMFSSSVPPVIFGYNVPPVLRGQMLQVHVQWFEEGFKVLIGTGKFTVKTFPNLNLIEVPRVLLFFFAFSTLPVSTFVPSPWKNKIETCLNQTYLNHRHRFLVFMIALFLGSVLYWNCVCKFFII